MLQPHLAVPVAIIQIGIDPVFFHIHWYGLMYAVAFVTAFRYGVVAHLSRYGIDRALMERVTGWTILFGLIGARLYYVVQSDLAYYLQNPVHIFAVWEGGMAFFGAIGASSLTLFVLSRRWGFSFWMALDAGAFFATIGQPIGRIGNVINGDILGPPSTAPWAMAYTNPHAILQPGFALCVPGTSCTAYQPAAVYEAIGTLIILGILLLLRRRHVAVGAIGISYVALYAVCQLVIFHWRAAMPTYHGLAQAQWTAVATLLIAVPALLLLWNASGRGRAVVPVDSPRSQPILGP